MKRILLAMALLLALPNFAQETKKEPDYVTNRDLRSKVFEVHSRDPHDIANSIRLLGSGTKGAAVDVNSQLKTITVRDFPENLATIEDAIKRLDVPATVSTDAEMRMWVVIGSKSAIPNAQPLPEDLEPVVKELRSTLRYSNYALMAATVNRVARGIMVQGSGVAEPEALGMPVKQEQPVLYTYALRNPEIMSSNGRQALTTDGFNFSMRIPIDVGKGSIQYQSVGFETPVTVRDKEKVVIGTTTMGDKALIVIVTADITK
ncbi:MAG TPA: secretin N-terminal domain-containing protein [Thermoanaerobaculia bacterium]|nr:secretin N-terminal domain-containing protein [Thermoanaerobaculia bacterium]